MNQSELKQRTKEFSKRVVKLCGTLTTSKEERLIASQLFRSATSVAANYREACRARSPAEFVSKLGIVEAEGDESLYWLELLAEMEIIKPKLLEPLINEANEIVAIIVASIKTARGKKKSTIRNPQSAIPPYNIFKLNGFRPVVHESAFVHPNATVTGNVVIGKDVYIGPGAAIRGDWGEIVIHDGCNVQENCTIHQFPGITVVLEEMAHIGHGAIIHGAHIGRNALVGMNAVVMDNAVVGEESIVGALCFVPEGMEIPRRKIAVGNPAKIVKDVSDEMAAWKTKGTELYISLPKQLYETLEPCEPLRELPEDRPKMEKLLETWRRVKKK